MKYLLLMIFVFFEAEAVSIAKYRSTPEGVFSQKFVLEEKSASFEKTSNAFDKAPGDYGIGLYKIKTVPSDFKATMKKLEEYAAKFKEVDDFLKTKDSSFNAVAGLTQHEAVILVDDFRIRPGSKYYKELEAIFTKLQRQNWQLEKGYRVTKDLEKVIEIEDGKAVKTLKYARDLYCNRAQLPATCTYHGGGKILVQ